LIIAASLTKRISYNALQGERALPGKGAVG